MHEVDELAAIAPRRAGSEAERRAARMLRERLTEAGREARVEPTRVRPGFPLANLIHAVAGVVGSVLAVYTPGIGLLIAALATLSALGDLTGAYPGIRALMPARASQNVVSDEDTGKPGLVVLVAHYDAPRAAALHAPRFAFWPRALLGSLALITLCAIGRVIGIDATWFTVLQFVPTVVLIVLSPLFADAALSDVSKGEADNAAGVATALSLATTKLEHFDLMLLFTGGSAHFGLGMRDWLKRYRAELDTEATAVICLDNLGPGQIHCATKEGPVFTSRMHPTLADLAEQAGAAPFTSRELSDAYLARSAGLPTIRISSEDPRAEHPPDPEALARVRAFVSDLLARIDDEIGARIA